MFPSPDNVTGEQDPAGAKPGALAALGFKERCALMVAWSLGPSSSSLLPVPCSCFIRSQTRHNATTDMKKRGKPMPVGAEEA